jgi:hypothetical protein
VETSRSDYTIGEQVDVTIDLQANESFFAREIRAELQCVGSYAIPVQYASEESTGGGSTSVWHAHERHTLGRETELTTGWRRHWVLTFQIPEHAPPTYRGDYIFISWSVGATIDVPVRRDVRADSLITVHRDAGAATIDVEDTKVGGGFDMRFDSEAGWVVEGQELRGTLVVTADQDVDAKRTWVEFNRIEEVRARLGGRALDVQPRRSIELASQGTYTGGLRTVIPFAVEIDRAERPFVQTDIGRAYGELRGVIDTGRRQVFVSRPVTIL